MLTVTTISSLMDSTEIGYAMDKMIAHMLNAAIADVEVEEVILLAHATGTSAVYAIVCTNPLKFQVAACDDGVVVIENITVEMMKVLNQLADDLSNGHRST